MKDGVKKGGETVRKKDTRKWDEGPSEEVEGNGYPPCPLWMAIGVAHCVAY
jgi:hypothetical protein